MGDAGAGFSRCRTRTFLTKKAAPFEGRGFHAAVLLKRYSARGHVADDGDGDIGDDIVVRRDDEREVANLL